MIMNATVIKVDRESLLVKDLSTGQEVLAFYRNAGNFSPGDRIRITFSGAMTFSIPPHITADSIQKVPTQPMPPAPKYPEIRAVVLQRRQNALLVRDLSNNRQLIVRTGNARHFCPGQRIVIRYETIFLNNPPEIVATEIIALC